MNFLLNLAIFKAKLVQNKKPRKKNLSGLYYIFSFNYSTVTDLAKLRG
ncbi:hypothetical protein H4V97_002107 [Flavobacterium sp. CG_23.5]|nr:hypothetical protein [Flavobacterium sp. CG_23.5]